MGKQVFNCPTWVPSRVVFFKMAICCWCFWMLLNYKFKASTKEVCCIMLCSILTISSGILLMCWAFEQLHEVKWWRDKYFHLEPTEWRTSSCWLIRSVIAPLLRYHLASDLPSEWRTELLLACQPWRSHRTLKFSYPNHQKHYLEEIIC